MEESLELYSRTALENLIQELNETDAKSVLCIKDELYDNWKKKQIFRTDTEMRISVLNDAKFPTRASKYWQAVREMSAMFDALISLTFDIRKNKLERLRLEKKFQILTSNADHDPLDLIELQIELDKNAYENAVMFQIAGDRIRELKNWSIIKKELDDGTFDINDVNSHQVESLHQYFANRVNSLNSSSAPGEVLNAIGPFQSITRLKNANGTLSNFNKDLTQLS